MTDVITDAVDQLKRHRGLSSVSEPTRDGELTLIKVDVAVELPSRSRPAGISETGVRAVETCVLVFGSDWPLTAPRVLLRADFPLNLPHINPHRAGELVSPCLFEGPLDEVLHRFGLDAIIDQLVDWLDKAAAGTLLNLDHGWEPTRRDSCPSTTIFSAEKILAVAPENGTVLEAPAIYLASGGGVHAFVNTEQPAPADTVFSQKISDDKFGHGRTVAFVVRAPRIDGEVPVFGDYQPETVVDLPALLDRAASLGINREALAKGLDDFYLRSVIDITEDARSWVHGLYAIVILLAQRPTQLVGSPGRSVEVLPYVVRYQFDAEAPMERNTSAHPAFHAHALSPELLALASGIPASETVKPVVVLGCGSLGSKIALQLARAGFGSLTFVDNESLSPHNAARHALTEWAANLIPPQKAVQMKESVGALAHPNLRAFDNDAVAVLMDSKQFAATIPDDATLIVDTTASLKVLAAETHSTALNRSPARLVRIAMYGQGRCCAVLLEASKRVSRVDDLTAFLFERCRTLPDLRQAIAGDTSDPTRIFVGDNCRSLTTPMSDAIVSRSASLAGIQLERWLIGEVPQQAVLCTGTADTHGLGMSWTQAELGPTISFDVPDDGGWHIRILHPVAQAIHADAMHWRPRETGGALIGRISFESRTITIAGLVDAPSDSIREATRFVLGTENLVNELRTANKTSLGYLTFIGTWHSHPQGGQHSGIDRQTLRTIAEEAAGLPAVSLVWTPAGLKCAVDRW